MTLSSSLYKVMRNLERCMLSNENPGSVLRSVAPPYKSRYSVKRKRPRELRIPPPHTSPQRLRSISNPPTPPYRLQERPTMPQCLPLYSTLSCRRGKVHRQREENLRRVARTSPNWKYAAQGCKVRCEALELTEHVGRNTQEAPDTNALK